MAFSWSSCIVLVCTLWNVEARSFKKQETALVQESVQAASNCALWSQVRTKCVGTGLSETGKDEDECREWCQTQGVGCCETSTTGSCTFVSGTGLAEYSPAAVDARATYCMDNVYTQLSRMTACGLTNADSVGARTAPGSVTVIECEEYCSTFSDCKFINYGGVGTCHTFTTCNGDEGGFWLVKERDLDFCTGVSCQAPDDCHTAGACDAQSGTCSWPPVADGTVCDDNNTSTISSQCTLGLCSGPEAGATGDPHFVGFDGSRYDFQGGPGSVFNIITDKAFQLNARFVESPTDGKTYMGTIGLRVGSNEIVVTPDVVVVNDGTVAKGDHVYLYDGEESLGLLVFDDLLIRVKAPSFQVDIKIAEQDGFVYLDVNAATNSDYLVHPHGILGQTAQYLVDGTQPQPVRLSHKNYYASGFLAGVPDDYIVADGLLGTDFAFNRFGIEAVTAKSQVSRRFGFGRVLYQQEF